MKNVLLTFFLLLQNWLLLGQSLPYTNFGMKIRPRPVHIDQVYAPVIVAKAPTNEATLIRLSSGHLRIFFIDRPGTARKMMSVQSIDNGYTWSVPSVEFELPGEAYYANQVMEDRYGTLHCVFHIYKEGPIGYRGRHLNLWYCRKELGASWTSPRMIKEGYVGSLRGMIELPSGSILIPMSESDTSRANRPPAGNTDYGLFQIMTLTSTDKGNTWNRSISTLNIPIESNWVTRYGAIEPNAIALKDGRIWMLIRTNKGMLYESFSSDEGMHWTEANSTNLISSDSPASTVRLKDGRIILLVNRNQRHDDSRSYAAGGREALHAAISNDDACSWNGFREVLTSPNTNIPKRGDRGTAYPSAIELPNNKVLFISGQGEEAAVVAFDPNWLEEKVQFDAMKDSSKWTFHGEKPKDGVWNFPMMKKGIMNIKLNIQDISDLRIALSDHFSISSDSLALESAPLVLETNIFSGMKGSIHIRIQWDSEKKKAIINVNKKSLTIPTKKIVNGFNYLRVPVALIQKIKDISVRSY